MDCYGVGLAGEAFLVREYCPDLASVELRNTANSVRRLQLVHTGVAKSIVFCQKIIRASGHNYNYISNLIVSPAFLVSFF